MTQTALATAETARFHMVESQIKPNRVTHEKLLKAIRATPRELFVPDALKPVAYVDEDLELVRGRFLLEPLVFARMAQEAQIGPRDTVLDVGGGTGYSAAVLAQLAGVVVALEEQPDLAARAAVLLRDLRVDNAQVVAGPLAAGHAAQAPYDVILVNGATEIFPDTLAAQLAEGGRMVFVDRSKTVGKAVLVTKSNGVLGRRELFDAAVAVLPGFVAPVTFKF